MRYRTGRTGTESNRKLNPYRVWYRSGGLYVVGMDHKSDEIRTFAVDRIRQIEPTDQKFEIPESFDFDSYMSSSFGVIADQAVKIRIRFERSWTTYVQERSWHDSQQFQELAGGKLELSLDVANTPDLRNWILSFGSGAEVLEPKALRAAVKREFQDALKRYKTVSS
jgi:predicted DNA-binding transcriptional regulator YafY